MKKVSTFLIILFVSVSSLYAQKFIGKTGKASFTSDAPMELINAASNELVGILNTTDRTFAFSIVITSFKGFNSELQREHFNENYMESDKYPKASFTGTIVENVDFSKDGTYQVNAKGKLNIHGVTVERTIPATIITKAGKPSISSKFTVKLVDHKIEIPTIVMKKVAEEVYITINIDVLKQP